MSVKRKTLNSVKLLGGKETFSFYDILNWLETNELELHRNIRSELGVETSIRKKSFNVDEFSKVALITENSKPAEKFRERILSGFMNIKENLIFDVMASKDEVSRRRALNRLKEFELSFQ